MTKEDRRSYDEGCIAAHALDLIGDRWALLVVRELLLGPRRFGALRAGMPGLSANVLTQRLEDLSMAGILRREDLPAPEQVTLYRLTAAGEALWPVIRELCRWGATMPGHDARLLISPAALMLSMRAMCDRDRAGPHRAVFRLGREAFTVETAPGAFRVTRGADPAAGLQFEGGTNAMARAVYAPQPLADSARGLIAFAGDPAEGQAFVDLFALRRDS
ncbi:helix-turn-helix transcriptional regulator [Rhodobacter sp. Har01]|uniref:winged helix-turn-helix transcriptional regulator n=1 Tax=Rhodobacter sp. Har01 TaxID=2883999 RepID=UPI001D068ADB|nr:helix-turn-helix domain-containing protein [Rhodobacter sp. Har01]MCB6176525.1 helix-turn-helix transcriptional regulator [Rhodobacter sp. Har01]